MQEHRETTSLNRPDRKSRFLLVVDSEADHLYFMSILLQRFGYKTFTAATAEEALTMTAVTVPSLIIIAARLRDMSGLDLIRQLKQGATTSGVTIIGLRSQDDPIGEKELARQGAKECLSKPVSVEQLYRTIQTTMETTPRSHIRVKTFLPVQSCSMANDCFDDACTTELSEGGMFVRTKKPVGSNTQLACKIHLQGQIVPVEAVVLYTNRAGGGLFHDPGMGLQFARITSRDQELIRRFVRNEVTRGIPPANA